MSKLHKNKIVSEKTRIKNSISQKGKVLSKKTKDKIGLNFKGKSLSKEHKNKISNSKKGIRTVAINFTKEVREKISNSKTKEIIRSDGKEYKSLTCASKDLNISISLISKSLKNEKHTAGGFKWKYKSI
jgi:hypothetical protein